MDKLKEVLSIQSSSYEQFRMFAYIIRQIKEMPNVDYFVEDGNIYIQKGVSDTYPCMVAHMDTVHKIVEDLYPVEIEGDITGFNRVTMEQTGIGGDDKVGIFIALECLKEFDEMKIAFFRDEEVGCEGSYIANMHFFRDCRFVLQCDRRGNTDFVINASGVELSSKAFQDDVLPIISGYGYKFAHGMMTDVMALKENGIKCSVANMSCGYYNPHCDNEYVNINDVMECMEMCKTIITYCTDTYKHKARKNYASYRTVKAPKVNDRSFYDMNDYDYYDTQFKDTGDNLCVDCYGDIAKHKGGLCDTCNEWYKRTEYTNKF